ncbi:MAG: hypothetical protein HUU55_07460 [Myxococcales bacterium]|nr:hypothetical protein [Myxococcales bacterium]
MISPNWPPYLEQIWHRYQTAVQPVPDPDRRCFRSVLGTVVSGRPIINNVTVGGTNGKGAVAAMLETTLLREGISTGLFVSPHLWSVTERFRINGDDVGQNELDKASIYVDTIVQQTCAADPNLSWPTFFETLVLIAWVLFSEMGVQVAIWEAGIGGGKDSISLISATVCALVSVSLDHTRFLGNSVSEIAAEKARLAPSGVPMVLGLLDSEADEAATTELRRRNCPVIRPVFDIETAGSPSSDGQRFRCGNTTFKLPLLGAHQAGNISVVRSLYQTLQSGIELPEFDFLHLSHTRWPGRTEWISGRPSFFIDVAHNPDAFVKIGAIVASLAPFQSIIVLFGASLGRDHPRCDHLARTLGAEIRFVEGFYRAAPTTTWITGETDGAVCYVTPSEAVYHLQSSPSDQEKLVVVVGSAFLAGAIRHVLRGSAETDK